MKESRIKRINKRTREFRQRVNVHIYVLPNLLTTGNMFFGFLAIIYSIRGEFSTAAYAIVAAAIFDLLDGRVARMTHSTSPFGAQYDSMADLISFGAAPALLLFFWSLEPFGRIGWLTSFFYLACAGLRLAKFNVQNEVADPAFFQGLPTPAAAGIVASSILAFTDLGLDARGSYWILAMTFLLGFVMVSQFNYRSFKDLEIRNKLPFKYLVVTVFSFAIIAIKPEVTLFIVFLTYALLGAAMGIIKGHPILKISKKYSKEAKQDLDSEKKSEL